MSSKMVESTWAHIGHFLYQLDPDIARLVRRLEYLHLKTLKKETIHGIQPNLFYIYVCVCGVCMCYA